MISVLILTLNESANLAECLKTVPWTDDVHILDSTSTDGTVEIARSLGATVHERPFTAYAEQRTAGLALPFRHPWILMLDADERLTPGLAAEIETRIAGGASQGVAAYRVRRKDMFMGRWIRHASGYPTWFPRLFRKGRVAVLRDVNEEYVPDGLMADLQGHLLHYPFNKGVAWWIDRHNRYSTMEAATLAEERRSRALSLRDLFARDPAVRRGAQKQLFYRMPARPFIAFLYLYVIKLGFLDGRAGFHFCLLRTSYEIMITVKEAQLKS